MGYADTASPPAERGARVWSRRGAALAATVLLAGGIAACGNTVSTSKFSGASHAVAQRISDFQNDLTTGDEQKLCEKDLAKSVHTRLTQAGSNCRAALKHQLATIDDFELSVQSIAVHGANATARVKSSWSGKLQERTLELVKEGGAWRVSAVR